MSIFGGNQPMEKTDVPSESVKGNLPFDVLYFDQQEKVFAGKGWILEEPFCPDTIKNAPRDWKSPNLAQTRTILSGSSYQRAEQEATLYQKNDKSYVKFNTVEGGSFKKSGYAPAEIVNYLSNLPDCTFYLSNNEKTPLLFVINEQIKGLIDLYYGKKD